MTTKKGPPMKKFFGPYRKTFQQKWDSKSQKGDCHALEKSSAASSLDEVSVFRKKRAQPEAPATDKTDEWTAEKPVQLLTKVIKHFVSIYLHFYFCCVTCNASFNKTIFERFFNFDLHSVFLYFGWNPLWCPPFMPWKFQACLPINFVPIVIEW